MFNRLPRFFLNSRYGEPMCKVNIVALSCEKFEFPSHGLRSINWCMTPNPSLRCDVDLLIRFGRAFEMARLFQKMPWYMTKEGIMVCGERLGQYTAEVTLAVDDDYNLSFLADCKKHILREGDAFRAEVKNMYPKAGNEPGVGLPLILLGDDV